jgi:hypothetical protein
VDPFEFAARVNAYREAYPEDEDYCPTCPDGDIKNKNDAVSDAGGPTECKAPATDTQLVFKVEQLTFFQDPASVEMYQLITLHNNLCYYLYGILCVVL